MYGYRGGFGFRGSTPPWPYIGRGRGGLPRCGYYLRQGYSPFTSNTGPYQQPSTAYGDPRYISAYETWYHPETRFSSKEDELNSLKNEAEAIKAHLNEIDVRIQELESK